MIDIHNHILVDIDDGPKTIEKSIALLKQAKDEGVTSIVATPHHLHPRYDNTFQQVLVKLAELRTHPDALQAVSRLAGNDYAKLGGIFTIKRPEK